MEVSAKFHSVRSSILYHNSIFIADHCNQSQTKGLALIFLNRSLPAAKSNVNRCFFLNHALVFII